MAKYTKANACLELSHEMVEDSVFINMALSMKVIGWMVSRRVEDVRSSTMLICTKEISERTNHTVKENIAGRTDVVMLVAGNEGSMKVWELWNISTGQNTRVVGRTERNMARE
jgi:hypothetical protein